VALADTLDVGAGLGAVFSALKGHICKAADRVASLLVARNVNIGNLLVAAHDGVQLTKLAEELDEVLLSHIRLDTSHKDTTLLVHSREVLGMVLGKELDALVLAHGTGSENLSNKDTLRVLAVGMLLNHLLGCLGVLRNVVDPDNGISCLKLGDNLVGCLVVLKVGKAESTEAAGAVFLSAGTLREEPGGHLSAVLEEVLDDLLSGKAVEALDVDVGVTVARRGALVRRKEGADRALLTESRLAVACVLNGLLGVGRVLELAETVSKGRTLGIGLDDAGVDVTVLGHEALESAGVDLVLEALDKDLAVRAVALAAVVLLVHDTAGLLAPDADTVQLGDSLVGCLHRVKVDVSVAEGLVALEVTGDTDRTDVSAGLEDVEKVLLSHIGVEVTDVDRAQLRCRRGRAGGIKALRSRCRWNKS